MTVTRFWLVSALILGATLSAPAQAPAATGTTDPGILEEPGSKQKKPSAWKDIRQDLEIRWVIEAGATPFIGLYSNVFPMTTPCGYLQFGLRIRSPRVSALALEVATSVPYGAGANLLFDVVKTKRVRIHVLDPGVFWNWWLAMNVQRVKRPLDLTIGAGMEIAIDGRDSIVIDWRWYFPNPARILPRYGDFARPVYDEASKGGVLWLGYSRSWW